LTYKNVVPAVRQETEVNVTRPRAADDFPMIRARMEELRSGNRSRIFFLIEAFHCCAINI